MIYIIPDIPNIVKYLALNYISNRNTQQQKRHPNLFPLK
jgi:hypothetical protein